MYTLLLVTFWNLFSIFYLLFIPTYSLFWSILPTFLFLYYPPSFFSPNFKCLLFGFCFQYTLNLFIAICMCMPVVLTVGTQLTSQGPCLLWTLAPQLPQSWGKSNPLASPSGWFDLVGVFWIHIKFLLIYVWNDHTMSRQDYFDTDIYSLWIFHCFSLLPLFHGNSWVWT